VFFIFDNWCKFAFSLNYFPESSSRTEESPTRESKVCAS